MNRKNVGRLYPYLSADVAWMYEQDGDFLKVQAAHNALGVRLEWKYWDLPVVGKISKIMKEIRQQEEETRRAKRICWL